MFVKKVMNIKYDSISNTHETQSTVYVLQELPGTRIGRPKYNIIGAQKFGKLKVLLKENTQIVITYITISEVQLVYIIAVILCLPI